jgi:hypothetical protein
MTEVQRPCCETWAKAHESGTDNEGYGSLIAEGLRIGYELPPVRFCPWCGSPKESVQRRGCDGN